MTPNFLKGGGLMGAMLRGHDAADTPLGASDKWPLSLRNLVSIMLGSPQPMFITWGPQRLMIYNDPYIEILGRHHPALGRPFEEVWPEVADQALPILARAYAGEPVYMNDLGFVLHRHGRPEQTYFTFSYTPIYDENGEVSGALCACTETTARVAELHRREEELDRLRAIFEESPAPVAVLRGPEHRFELANPAFAALTGRRAVAGISAATALPELEGQGFFEPLDAVYASGLGSRHEAMTLRFCPEVGAGPLTRRVDFAFEPLRGDGGQVTGIVVQGVDLTRAYEQAQVLRQSEEKFYTFAQAMPNHVWTAPADGQIDWFNDQVLVYTGMATEALAGAGWVQLVHTDDVPRAVAVWSNALATGGDYEIEFRIRRHDGSYRWHLVRALPIRNTAGAVVRWIGTNTDIEEQRSDREALRELNGELERRVDERTRERERIWRNSPDLMAVVGLDGSLTEVNPAWHQILGWQPDQLVGAGISMLVHPDDLSSAWGALSRASQGVLPTFECRVRHADGSYRHVAWTAAPEGLVVFAFGRDITQSKEQQQALLQTAEQLRQAQKMEAIGQLTGGIAHDFNNMLASIHGSIQLIQRRLASGRSDNFETLLERAAASTQRAAALTQRLLAFARRHPLEIRRINLRQLVTSLEDMFVRSLDPKVRLSIVLSDDLWAARVDGSQLENALLNLVINARDAMPDGGQLTVEAANVVLDADYAATEADFEPGSYVAILVSDNGVGMPPQVIARAFEPFFTTKPIGQGTGLGLSMVYGFAKQAGGHIRIHSQAGFGTTVSLFLPRDASEADDPESTSARDTPGCSGAGETILVVEDEVDVRAVIVAVLEDLGYRYIEAADATAALAVIDSGAAFDLLVTDVGLPGMNGRQLAEIASARRPGLKVLLVTGYAEQAAAREGFLSAGMQMITKPFMIEELARRVSTMLGAAGVSEAA